MRSDLWLQGCFVVFCSGPHACWLAPFPAASALSYEDPMQAEPRDRVEEMHSEGQDVTR